MEVIKGAYKHIAACGIPGKGLWKCAVSGNPYDGSAIWETVLKTYQNKETDTIIIETETKVFAVPKYWMVPILLNDNSSGLQN